jgi:hypothetical protein
MVEPKALTIGELQLLMQRQDYLFFAWRKSPGCASSGKPQDRSHPMAAE